MEERREQFECSYCGQKFNFRKHAEEHERDCPARGKADPDPASRLPDERS